MKRLGIRQKGYKFQQGKNAPWLNRRKKGKFLTRRGGERGETKKF